MNSTLTKETALAAVSRAPGRLSDYRLVLAPKDPSRPRARGPLISADRGLCALEPLPSLGFV